MLYRLMEKKRGNVRVLMVDERKKVNDRLDTLRNSYRGKKIELYIEEAPAEDEKFYQNPHHFNPSGSPKKFGGRRRGTS